MLAGLAAVAPIVGTATLSAQGAGAAASASSGALRPGDVLRLRVWREPELSGEFMVDEHGELTLPRLGRRSVSNVPLDSIRARIVREYGEFLRDATIEVTPLYRVRVSGAVRTPGLFTVDPTITVGDALGLAGGVTSQGRSSNVALVRDGRRIPTLLSSGTRLAELSLRSGDELFVPERSWLTRNGRYVIGAMSATASLIWAIRR